MMMEMIRICLSCHFLDHRTLQWYFRELLNYRIDLGRMGDLLRLEIVKCLHQLEDQIDLLHQEENAPLLQEVEIYQRIQEMILIEILEEVREIAGQGEEMMIGNLVGKGIMIDEIDNICFLLLITILRI